MNDFHEFPFAESAKLDLHGAQIDTPGISIFESRVAACVRAQRIKIVDKLPGPGLSLLFKKTQRPDRKGPLIATGAAARSFVQRAAPNRECIFNRHKVLNPLIETDAG
jgi:hypothetical protein